jgi:hypothetical protein
LKNVFFGKTVDCTSDFCYNKGKKRQPPIRQDLGLPFGGLNCMNIVAKNNEIIKAFWIYFHILGDGTEWIDYGLPTPTIHKHINKGYFIGWAIDGFFGTKKGQEFLNDIIARFLISFADKDIKRLPFKPTKKDLASDAVRIYAKVYKLREFSKQLDSLPTKKFAPTRADSFEDFTFWAIKLYAEDMIRATGFIVYQSLENWAMTQFLGRKERSTIRAKCRSVFNWYEARNFDISTKKTHRKLKDYLEETKMTRQEHMKRVSAEKAKKNKCAVINIMTGLYADEYKKKSGSWHYGKIAETIGLSSKTVAKIIKEYEKSKEI